MAPKRELFSDGEDPVADLLQAIPDPASVPADAGYDVAARSDALDVGAYRRRQRFECSTR